MQPTYSEKQISISASDIQKFSLQVKKETEEMHAFCTDVEKNIPIDKPHFTKTAKPDVCNYCNFRELCR